MEVRRQLRPPNLLWPRRYLSVRLDHRSIFTLTDQLLHSSSVCAFSHDNTIQRCLQSSRVTKILDKKLGAECVRNPQREIKGQQRKGKIISELSLFFTLFQNFSPRTFPFKQRVLAQGEQKRRKDNKKNRTNRCCTLVVARLSSSCFSHDSTIQRCLQNSRATKILDKKQGAECVSNPLLRSTPLKQRQLDLRHFPISDQFVL